MLKEVCLMSRFLLSQYVKRVVLVLFCLPMNLKAQENQNYPLWVNDINWHGFLSQGFVATDENNFLGSSSDGSFKYTEAGLSASWRANEKLLFSLQGLYRQTGSAEPKGVNLDYATVDWRVANTFDYGLGLRIGRLKNPYGFFNETRDVAATRPSILLSESIYIDYLRELLHSSDSAGFYAHRELSEGTLSFNANFGQPILNDQIVSSLVSLPTNGRLDSESVKLARMMYERGDGLWRAGLSYVNFEADFKPSAGEPFLPGSLSTEQYLVSMEINWNNWQLVGEYQVRDIQSKGILGTTIKREGLAYYAQLGYRFTPSLNAYFRRDHVYGDKNDKSGDAYALATGGQNHADFAKDTMLGMNYSPSFEWSFGLECHVVEGTFWLPNLENPNVAAQKKYWNMFLAQAAYRF